MSEAVQITLIVCGTIIFLFISSFSFMKNIINKEFHNTQDAISKAKRDTERFGYCKSPTYPAPPRPGYQPNKTKKDCNPLKSPSTGSGIGHNPSPPDDFKKTGFLGRGTNDTEDLDKLFKRE